MSFTVHRAGAAIAATLLVAGRAAPTTQVAADPQAACSALAGR